MLGHKRQTPDFFEGWYKSQNDLEEKFKDFTQRMSELINTNWGNKIPGEVLKFMNFSFFEEFYKNWIASLELPGGVKNPLGMDGGWQQATNFLRTFMQKENPFFSSFSNTKITDQLSWMFGMLQGALGKEESAIGSVLSGYQDIVTKLFESTTAQSTEKLAKGFEAWAAELEKHLLAPKVGINREMSHDISQALVMSKDYINAYCKMTRLIEETSRKAGIRFQTKLSELALKNKPVNKFEDLCALWSVENEAVFLEVMSTQEFAKLQGDYVDAGHRLKIQWHKLAEKALEPTPIALKRDLDLAIAEIQQMKRDMRTFRIALRDNEHALQVAREAQIVANEEAEKAKAAAKAAESAARNEAEKAKAAVHAAELAARNEVEKAKAAAKTAAAAAKDEVAKAKTAVKAAETAAKNEAKKAAAAIKAASSPAQKKATKTTASKVVKSAAQDEAVGAAEKSPKRGKTDKTVNASTATTTKTKTKNV